MEKEVDMDEAAEMGEGMKDDERLSDAIPLESKQTDAQVGKSSTAPGRDYFGGGESAW